MKGTMMVRGLLGVLAILMLSLTFAAGCNLLASDQDQALEKQKQKNEELQKQLEEQQEQEARRKEKEEEARQKELEQQVEDLQKQVDSQAEKSSQENASQPTESSQPEQSQPQQAEEQARAAAESYYQAVEAGDWGYTYDHLDSETQGAFTREEWFAKNQAGASAGPATFAVQYVGMDDSSQAPLANVTVLVTGEDGSTNVRNTYWVYEEGSWLHRFSPEEYDLLAAAPAGSSSASPGASATASASSSDGGTTTDDTKHVKVVITSSKPADVSINDDSLNWFITEEITGTETYERDIGANSGLSVSATTDAYRAQTTIEVYENGELVAQDSDPNGLAMVNY